MPSYPEFPVEEYAERYARARTMMPELGLDALLITEELNYVYFTGHRSPQNSVDNIRPYVFVLDKEGEGTIITMPFEVDHVLECTWITDIYQASLMDRTEAIISVLKQKGLAKGRIGTELGREQSLGLSYKEFTTIIQSLPQAEFIDAAPILLRLRAVKSRLEVDLIRKAASITATAIAATFENIHAGMSEIEVMRVLRNKLANYGAERVNYLAVCSGVTPNDGLVCIPTERRLRAGEILVLDAGVEWCGYNSDVARSASVGEPTAEVAEFYSWLLSVRQKGIEHLRAGKTPRDVVSAVREAIVERGLETLGSGRIGHGVGLSVTEYPSLTMEEAIVFEPGMVFTCNPNFVLDFGFVNVEDDWVITAGDPELLSLPASPDTLPVIRCD